MFLYRFMNFKLGIQGSDFKLNVTNTLNKKRKLRK